MSTPLRPVTPAGAPRCAHRRRHRPAAADPQPPPLRLEWVPCGDAARALEIGLDWARKQFRAGGIHAHHSDGGSKTGQWWMTAAAVTAAVRGASPTNQRRACGCDRPGWSPPPTTAGSARRTRRT